MSAWKIEVEGNKHQETEEVDKTFEDNFNFTTHESLESNKLPFQDSADYIKKLG